MKMKFKAKIIGHEWFKPDPKNDPKLDAIRVRLAITPVSQAGTPTARFGKPSKGILLIGEEDLPKFPGRGFLTITIEEAQAELDFMAPAGTKTDDAQVAIPGTQGSRRGRSTKKGDDD